MASLNQKSEKQHLKLVVHGFTDSGKTTLHAAISKTLGYYQRNLLNSSVGIDLHWITNIQINISNREPNVTFETPNNLITIFPDPGWKFQ